MPFLCKCPVQNAFMMLMVAAVYAVTCWYVCRQLKVQGCCRWLFPLHCQPEGGFQLRKRPLMGLGMVEDSTGLACRCCLTSVWLAKFEFAIASQ